MNFKLTPKKYFLVLALMGFVLLCLIVGFLYLSFYGEIGRVDKEKESLTQEIVFLRDILSRREKEEDIFPLIQKNKSALLCGK